MFDTGRPKQGIFHQPPRLRSPSPTVVCPALSSCAPHRLCRIRDGPCASTVLRVFGAALTRVGCRLAAANGRQVCSSLGPSRCLTSGSRRPSSVFSRCRLRDSRRRCRHRSLGRAPAPSLADHPPDRLPREHRKRLTKTVPQVLGEVSKSQAWIWLEARDGAGPHALWTIEQLASAAYDFGALGAQWRSKLPDVRRYPWLAQRWLRGWVALVRIYAVDHFLEHDGCGNGSAVEPFLNESMRRRMAELISDADDPLAGFESLPVTLAHHDPQ